MEPWWLAFKCKTNHQTFFGKFWLFVKKQNQKQTAQLDQFNFQTKLLTLLISSSLFNLLFFFQTKKIIIIKHSHVFVSQCPHTPKSIAAVLDEIARVGNELGFEWFSLYMYLRCFFGDSLSSTIGDRPTRLWQPNQNKIKGTKKKRKKQEQATSAIKNKRKKKKQVFFENF